MGNPDLVFIFNRDFALLVSGKEYNSDGDAYTLALEKFEIHATRLSERWHSHMRDGFEPEEGFCPTSFFEIKSIESYEVK